MNNLLYLLPGEDLSGFLGRFHFLNPNKKLELSRNELGLKGYNIKPHRLGERDDFHLMNVF